jgi:hypothetical protein
MGSFDQNSFYIPPFFAVFAQTLGKSHDRAIIVRGCMKIHRVLYYSIALE